MPKNSSKNFVVVQFMGKPKIFIDYIIKTPFSGVAFAEWTDLSDI